MIEAGISPDTPEDDIQKLKNAMIGLTLFPDVLFNFESEDTRSQQVDSVKAQLKELGVDADHILREAIISTMLPTAQNVIEVEFGNKAS